MINTQKKSLAKMDCLLFPNEVVRSIVTLLHASKYISFQEPLLFFLGTFSHFRKSLHSSDEPTGFQKISMYYDSTDMIM